jgi:hypothetical protein
MSEFKFACPVCGQHMNCDSSHAGSVMECPTCFQKITAPQTTATGEQKFILTGTKFAGKKISAPPAGTTGQTRAKLPMFPFWIVIVIVVVLAAAGGIFFLNGKCPNEIARSVMPAAPVLSSAWQTADIGTVGLAGAMSQADGVATLSGSGADIWQRADGFQFVFQALNGDGTLAVQVLNIQNTDEWAKAGVMIRETANAGSVFALASLRSDGQAQFIWRNATGAEAQASGLVGGTGYPKFVKVARSGNRFSAYYKVNAGDVWSQMGTAQTIGMAAGTEIGLIVCAHNNGVICQAQFDQVTLQTNNQVVGK